MPTRNDHDQLDDRKAAILKSVVTGYVETAQPVGSSQVARDPVIEVSPATVRADMAALEREGYLTHPHTSAGRIPTDKGYRFFVDHLGNPQPLGAGRARAGAGLLLEGTRRAGAGAAGHLAPARPAHRLRGVVVSPAYQALVVRSALIARLSTHTAMAVVVLSNGVVEKRTIAIREEIADTVLSAASIAHCNSAFRAARSGSACRDTERRRARLTSWSGPASARSRTPSKTGRRRPGLRRRRRLHGRAVRRHRHRSGPCSGSSSSPMSS